MTGKFTNECVQSTELIIPQNISLLAETVYAEGQICWHLVHRLGTKTAREKLLKVL